MLVRQWSRPRTLNNIENMTVVEQYVNLVYQFETYLASELAVEPCSSCGNSCRKRVAMRAQQWHWATGNPQAGTAAGPCISFRNLPA